MKFTDHYNPEYLADAVRYWDDYYNEHFAKSCGLYWKEKATRQKPMKIKAIVDLTEYDEESNWGKIELAGTGDDEGTWLTLCGSIKPDADAHDYDYEITIKRVPKQ